ncbi:MAG: hypothetical protein FLDDKLPJ_00377 [Phycisphaerae bacterium]|nr:hypothetical protein [Phycisphaerae bacterium]
MRARAVLPALTSRHDVLLLAGGDAYEALSPDYPVTRIPILRFQYRRPGRISVRRTLGDNAGTLADLGLRRGAMRDVIERIRAFNADVVISDSEVFTNRAAACLRAPRISFDHFGVLVYCHLPLGAIDQLRAAGQAAVYRLLMGTPQRVVVSSFFDAAPKRPGVRVIGPVIRPEARALRPSDGEHLLAYFSIGEKEFDSRVEQALRQTGIPVRVYGAPRTGTDGNLTFKPIANRPFLEDFASCRAILGTTGNQLLSEALHFGKPVLGLPIDCLEQRVNAAAVERLGIGWSRRREDLSSDLIRSFLERTPRFRERLKGGARDGEREAIEAIEAFAVELTGSRGRSPGSPESGCRSGVTAAEVIETRELQEKQRDVRFRHEAALAAPSQEAL